MRLPFRRRWLVVAKPDPRYMDQQIAESAAATWNKFHRPYNRYWSLWRAHADAEGHLGVWNGLLKFEVVER